MGQPDQGWSGGGTAGGSPSASWGQQQNQQWGQPNQQDQQSQHWGQQAPWTGGEQAPGGAAPSGGGRSRLWIVLGCAGLVVILLIVAITGGILLLVSQRGGGEEETSSAPQTTVFETEDFRLEYPADWVTHEVTEQDAGFGKLLQITDVEIPPEDELDRYPPNSLEVYKFESDVHAEVECEMQAIWAGFGWDESGDEGALEGPELGGRPVHGYTKSGEHDGADAITEGFCADVGDEIVQVVVETHGSTEISPALREILASWTWAAEG